MPDASSSDTNSSATAFQVIRAALIGGVVLMAGAFWFVLREQDAPILDPQMQDTFRYALLALFGAIGLGVMFIRQQWAAASDGKKKRSLTIVGWALAEGMALVGAVYYFLSSSPAFLLVGLLAQIFVSYFYITIPSGTEAQR